ncbi:MAG: metallophosphoesterase [Elusimicrobia bacterium]|nr:metallophosphoesterase [Elusimicrobiota bacterium]
MRRLLWLSALLALCACVPRAFAADAGVSVPFDGADTMGFDILERVPLRLLSSIQGKPAPAAPRVDLAEAGKVWGNDVQIAKLLASHPEPKASFQFAVIGDAEPGRFPWQRIFAPSDAFRKHIRRIQGKNADFMIQLGDIVSKGVEGNYVKLVEFLNAEVRLPFLVVPGNHDRSQPNGEADKNLFKAVFVKTDYTFDYNGWRFIVLDSADRRLLPEQLSWLAGLLETRLPVLVFTHVPPGYLRGLLVSPMTEKGYNMSGYFDEGSAEFRKLVSAAKVARVYFGHIHALGTAQVDGVRYVLTAGGGSPLYPLPPGYPKRKTTHFLGVEAGPWGLRETVFELDGKSHPLF